MKLTFCQSFESQIIKKRFFCLLSVVLYNFSKLPFVLYQKKVMSSSKTLNMRLNAIIHISKLNSFRSSKISAPKSTLQYGNSPLETTKRFTSFSYYTNKDRRNDPLQKANSHFEQSGTFGNISRLDSFTDTGSLSSFRCTGSASKWFASDQRTFCAGALIASRQMSCMPTTHRILKPEALGFHHIPSRCFSLDGFYTALAQSPPIQMTQQLLLELHHWLPWWALIPLATLAIRSLVVFPLAVHQQQVIGRLARVNAEMAHVAPALNKEVELVRMKAGWSKHQARRVFHVQMRQIYRRSVERDNCHPFKMALLVLFQMPLWVCLSVSLRNLTAMAQAGFPSASGLKDEGLLWFRDLTSPDPLLLPLAFLIINLTLTELHALRQMGKGGLLHKVMLNGSRVIIFVIAAAATLNPTSVTYYWACSSALGLCQGLVLMSPRVRHLLRLSPSSPTPYADTGRNLAKKLTWLRSRF